MASTRRRFLWQLLSSIAACGLTGSVVRQLSRLDFREHQIAAVDIDQMSPLRWFRRPKFGTHMGWIIEIEPAGLAVDDEGDQPLPFPRFGPWHITVCRDEPNGRAASIETRATSVENAETFAVAWIDARIAEEKKQ
jgi:hypothetical protein